MRITRQQLRQIIREGLLREKRYLKRIDAVADVQTALNVALAGEPGFRPLEVDKQWGPVTDAAWNMFIRKFYKPTMDSAGNTGPAGLDVADHWEVHGVTLGYDDLS